MIAQIANAPQLLVAPIVLAFCAVIACTYIEGGKK